MEPGGGEPNAPASIQGASVPSYLHACHLGRGGGAWVGGRRAKRARAHGGCGLRLVHAPCAAHCPQLPTVPFSEATIGLHGCPEVGGGHGRACMELLAHKTALRAHALHPCAPQKPWGASLWHACCSCCGGARNGVRSARCDSLMHLTGFWLSAQPATPIQAFPTGGTQHSTMQPRTAVAGGPWHGRQRAGRSRHLPPWSM